MARRVESPESRVQSQTVRLSTPDSRLSTFRAAHTLLELIAATALLSITLVPALRLLRDSFEQGERIETIAAMTTLCVSKLEEHLNLAGAAWAAGTTAGDFSAEGRADLRYVAVRSDDAAAGGITDRLMAVTVTVWQDLDGDGSKDSGEPFVDLASKVAKMVRYPSASGS